LNTTALYLGGGVFSWTHCSCALLRPNSTGTSSS